MCIPVFYMLAHVLTDERLVTSEAGRCRAAALRDGRSLTGFAHPASNNPRAEAKDCRNGSNALGIHRRVQEKAQRSGSQVRKATNPNNHQQTSKRAIAEDSRCSGYWPKPTSRRGPSTLVPAKDVQQKQTTTRTFEPHNRPSVPSRSASAISHLQVHTWFSTAQHSQGKAESHAAKSPPVPPAAVQGELHTFPLLRLQRCPQLGYEELQYGSAAGLPSCQCNATHVVAWPASGASWTCEARLRTGPQTFRPSLFWAAGVLNQLSGAL